MFLFKIHDQKIFFKFCEKAIVEQSSKFGAERIWYVCAFNYSPMKVF